MWRLSHIYECSKNREWLGRLPGIGSADLLLHPVRLRIVKAFLGDRALTTSQLAAELDDVPSGSLYRHVALLTKAGVLQVVAERRVRGAVERTYTLRLFAARIDPAEVKAMSAEEHGQAFMAYVAGMLADADRYLASDAPDPIRDGADYQVGALWLTDAEFAELLRDLTNVFRPRLAKPPGKGRRRRMVYTVFLPAPAEAAAEPSEPTKRPRTRRKSSS
jgi:Helix-turn-helix domain